MLVLALIIWGVIQNDGRAGRPGINESFGEATLSVEPDADFELTTLDGRVISIADFRGKIVVIDFWSSWCAPCRAEGPVLADTYNKWRERGVEFIGIAIWDTDKAVQEFIEFYGIDYTNGIDESGLLAVEFGVSGIPEKFFVNPDGEIVKKVVGPNTREILDGILTKMTDEALGITSGG